MDQDFLEVNISTLNNLLEYIESSYFKKINNSLKNKFNEILPLLKNIDFTAFSILIENLEDELQLIFISKSNYQNDSSTIIFREHFASKFYISDCKFLSSDFETVTDKEIIHAILTGNYKIVLTKRNKKNISTEVFLLNKMKKVTYGFWNFSTSDAIIEKLQGVNILINI